MGNSLSKCHYTPKESPKMGEIAKIMLLKLCNKYQF